MEDRELVAAKHLFLLPQRQLCHGGPATKLSHVDLLLDSHSGGSYHAVTATLTKNDGETSLLHA